jgi:hypothetical protein
MLKEALLNLDQESLRRIAKALPKLSENAAPQTDDELWLWIKKNTGYSIPRKAVCPNHNAPFEFLADMYFNRVDGAVLLAPRGGGKTLMASILHYVNSKHKPTMESATVGAIENQAILAYSHIRRFVYDEEGNLDPDVRESKMRETVLKNGSSVKVIVGSLAGVNGPHPQLVHIDEVELMQPDVYQEAQQMPKGRSYKGRFFPAQELITSTRKSGRGLMQDIIDDIEQAEKEGKTPPFKFYQFCVREVVENQDHCCQIAHPRLAAEKRCPCDQVYGRALNEEGDRKSLMDVCRGDFARSDGFTPLSDLISIFTKSAPSIWDAQQECIKPSTEGLVIQNFDREKHGVRGYEPDPDNGPIFMVLDPGGSDAHAVGWYQYLLHDTWTKNQLLSKTLLKAGTIVLFDEIYIAEVGNNKVFELIVNHERSWRHKYPGFDVRARWVDPQARAVRQDMLVHIPPLLPAPWLATREVEEHIKTCNDMVDENRFVVDLDRCPMFVEEIEVWARNPRTGKPIDAFDHMMSTFRYALENIKIDLRLEERRGGIPVAYDRQSTLKGLKGSDLPVAFKQKEGGSEHKPETWRKAFGEPITYRR